jgi:2-keto-4-pentenoate hydratase/2-oxohepta-3-ene-1,7-dioic acid hydratase in catechol pathway
VRAGCRDRPALSPRGRGRGDGLHCRLHDCNDISDRSFKPNPDRKPRERDKFFDWMHGKWHDTFCPMGPCILAADEVPNPQDLPIKLTVNGQVKQNASTAEMVFPVAAIVSFLSRMLTLQPGDVIDKGTPSGVNRRKLTQARR